MALAKPFSLEYEASLDKGCVQHWLIQQLYLLIFSHTTILQGLPTHITIMYGLHLKFVRSLSLEKCMSFQNNVYEVVSMVIIRALSVKIQWGDWGIRLQWCYNEHDGISIHQPHDCLLSRLFRHRSKKTSKHFVTGLSEGNSPVNSPHKWLVMRKMFPFDDTIMIFLGWSEHWIM